MTNSTNFRAASILFLVPALLLGATPPHAPAPAPLRTFSFEHEAVLGTSLQLTFVASSEAEALRAEAAALDEIERIRKLISTWDPSSQAAELVRAGRLASPASELVDVLRLYDGWRVRTGGVYTARIGELTDLWRSAEKAARVPSHEAIRSTIDGLSDAAWRIEDSGAVTALTPHQLDLNSLGKGYIINRAVVAVQRAVPGVTGGIINVGGDIAAWGTPSSAAWRVAVADARRSADNAPPLTTLDVRNAAVSSSGNYARGFTIGGVHYSHILDPRTGMPADHNVGVTVIASDNATANALATSISILSPADGMQLLRTVPGAEALIVTRDGDMIRSAGFARYETRSGIAPRAIVARNLTATMNIDVATDRQMRHRPYVAAWVTDTAGHHIRTLAMWGNRAKYQRELSRWWSLASNDYQLVDAVTRATRTAGKYTLEWDGLDQAGKAAKPGPYVFWLEASYENGPHSYKSVTVSCAKGGTGEIPAASAFTGAQVTCAPEK